MDQTALEYLRQLVEIADRLALAAEGIERAADRVVAELDATLGAPNPSGGKKNDE